MDQQDIVIKSEELSPLLEEDFLIPKQEEDVPDYVNVNMLSEVKLEVDTTEEKSEVYQCSQCSNRYKKIDYLMIHKAVHSPQRFCPVCFMTFTCKRKLSVDLNRHIRDKMKEDKKVPLICNYCQKQFGTRKTLTLHIRVHTNERPYKCSICAESFKQLGPLKSHFVTHTKERRFICEVCKGSFTTASSLNRHKKRIHDKGKTIKCKVCDATFLNMADFRAHRREVHPDVGLKKTCPLCPAVLCSRFAIRKHREFHNDEMRVE